jgi:hypothetical protein
VAAGSLARPMCTPRTIDVLFNLKNAHIFDGLPAWKGVLKEGLVADLVLFDPATIASLPATVAYDLPAGANPAHGFFGLESTRAEGKKAPSRISPCFRPSDQPSSWSACSFRVARISTFAGVIWLSFCGQVG